MTRVYLLLARVICRHCVKLGTVACAEFINDLTQTLKDNDKNFNAELFKRNCVIPDI